MNIEHPNIAVLQKFDPTNIAGSSDVIALDAVFHYFNPRLPDVHGDYVGVEGFKSFFKKIEKQTNEAFKVNLVSATPIGNELVVIHRKHETPFEGENITVDVVVVWRIVDSKIVEVWDIPSIYHHDIKSK
ncbi:nuclear transport factor 2 family protein [Aquimarina gracilis]|uniref:Nuclear transport factor 2 family protein n=1 Tax=Aquimarina gracilis TaxID=874422 RepID=A0ABU5ZXZ8_9FLAO|nr:nuclear transport factor 2 family protein [Aquimarina gracilis]MEB3346736.1 nuclear transport factor 2 family protein [Aquimarina gracilis]